mgnify:FL=1
MAGEIDPEEKFERKMGKNRSREYKHGKVFK